MHAFKSAHCYSNHCQCNYFGSIVYKYNWWYEQSEIEIKAEIFFCNEYHRDNKDSFTKYMSSKIFNREIISVLSIFALHFTLLHFSCVWSELWRRNGDQNSI